MANTVSGVWLAGAALAIMLCTPIGALAEPITPDLVAAAEKEGTVTWYTATETETAQAISRAFEKKYPSVKVVLERNGGERIFQRVGQEYGSNIYNVDVASSSEIGHAVYWKKQGWLAKYVPEDVEKFWPAEFRDPQGMYAIRSLVISVFSYNTNLVQEQDAPKSWKDLLDPKWKGKLVKSHPGYSGTSQTATYLVSREFGWDYYAQLAKNNVMQTQSGGDPPRKVAMGERLVALDGSEQITLVEIAKGAPLRIVYPSDGVPVSATPTALMAKARHPNAGKLFMSFLFTAEGQQVGMDNGNIRGLHPDLKYKGQPPLSQLKLLVESDPDKYLKESENVKKNYEKFFLANNNR